MKLTASEYLVGYGSLINETSRKRTIVNCTAAIPVVVESFTRSWSYKCPRRQYTAVSVTRVADKTARINAVLIPLHNPKDDLRLLDIREMNYSRGRINPDGVRFLDNNIQIPKDCIVWIYENHTSISKNYSTTSNSQISQVHAPSKSYPIPQSYLDCILKGCLQISIEFAKMFLSSTKGWEFDCMLDDRNASHEVKKYIGEVDDSHLDLVDHLLRESFPRIL
jgi:hypothetical protein